MEEGSQRQGAGSRRRKRPLRRRRRRPADKNRLASHLASFEASLTSAIREAYGEMFGAPSHEARSFTLDLKVWIDPGPPWRLKADPPVEEQIRTAVREMATRAEAFRKGSVYCYRCDSSACLHSHPPRPTTVFGGYASTGLPLWPEFSQILLEGRHPHIDLLYGTSEIDLLALYVNPETLKQRQLNVFGRQSKTYDILGQVVFGYLKVRSPGTDRSEPERVAFTLQAVEFRRLDGTPRVDLNVLARLSDGSPAIDGLRGLHQTRVSDVIASARQRIRSLGPASKACTGGERASSMPDTPALVEDFLRGLARKLEKVGRQQGRRTAHAEGHTAKDRPTSRARQDAFTAPADSVLWDRHESTFVVLGPRRRVHVFSPEGRHVTSLVLASEAVRSRKQRKRWLPLTDEQWERFGSAIGLPAHPVTKQPSPPAS
jgi:hypothetical protein